MHPEERPDPIIDGRYRLLEPLGRGTVGAVYKAEHLWMHKTVAIKLLRPEVTASEEAVKRFAREARLASLIDNPHCVSVHDFARDANGTYYLVMEYLEGESLYALLRRKKRLDLATIRDVFGQLLEALGAAHQMGIVHRDMKPENVMLIRRGGSSLFAKILDFGIAKNQGGSGDIGQLTRAGFTVGTPEYISPEQATAVTVDGRADLYSTGTMLFECLTGRRPFEGDNPVKIASAHVHDPPPSPSLLCPEAEIPPALEAVVLKALEKKPEDRFPDAKSFAEALFAAIPEPGEAKSAPAPEPAPLPAPPPAPTPTQVGLGEFLAPLFRGSFWAGLGGGAWRTPEHLGRLLGAFGVLTFLLSLLLRIL